MKAIWFEFRCFLHEFIFFITKNFFNIFKFHKANFLENQRVRFTDERYDIKEGVIKEIIKDDGKFYYNVLVFDYISTITENQIIHVIE